MYKLNDIFTRKGFESDVRITDIKTHEVVKGKKDKLPKPIFTFEYMGTNRKKFTCYESDITNLIGFERWELRKDKSHQELLNTGEI